MGYVACTAGALPSNARPRGVHGGPMKIKTLAVDPDPGVEGFAAMVE